jgi:hypothetical protein
MPILHVEWVGPLTAAQVADAGDPARDRGVYQICGSHPVHGSQTLLYIGCTSQKARTFAIRIPQHRWRVGRDLGQGHVSYFLGRLAGSGTPQEAEWKEQIEYVEALLVAAHKPSWNSSSVLDLGPERERRIGELHVLNWGVFGMLMPEVSAARWTERLAHPADYAPYGCHR